MINSSNSVWIGSAMEGLQAALDAGHAVLRAGGSAVDAAVASVVVLENDPHFNAGVGSVLTASGQHELEASLMSSSGSACGAATLLKQVANPIVLAKHVMEHTPHIFLSGPEAEQFAVQQGMQLVDNASFTTQQRKEQWQRYAAEQRLAPADEIVQKIGGPADAAAAVAGPSAAAADGSKDHCQTVGAVAIDSQGRLAAATSTGGRTNKWDGRIGDTPMIGSGTWADTNCAVSGTGVGEEFIRRAAAHDVAARMQYKGLSLAAAMHEVVWQSMAEGDGGFVGVDSDYNCVMDFNSVGMYRAAVDYRGNCVLAVFPDEVQQEEKQDDEQQEKQEGHGK